MPMTSEGYHPWIVADDDTGREPVTDEEWDTAICEQCEGDGVVDCQICERDDPDRFDEAGLCIDCGELDVIGTVPCDACSGWGTYAAIVAAGYGPGN